MSEPRNYAAEGRARLERYHAARAVARAEGERRFEGLQVLSGVTLTDDDKERYLIGFIDGWFAGKLAEGVHLTRSALQ